MGIISLLGYFSLQVDPRISSPHIGYCYYPILSLFFDDIPVLWWNWYGSKLPSPRIGVFTLKDLNLWSLRSLIWLIHIFMVLDQIPSIFWSPRSISLGYQFAYYDPHLFMIVTYYDEPRYFYSPMLLYYILMTFPHVV